MRNSGHPFEASRTAQWVAAARTLGSLLPDELLLARDPFGIAFARGRVRKLGTALLRHPWLGRKIVMCTRPMTQFVLWMQLRTRAIDDVLLTFAGAGGRQVVLLGAGFDARAQRFPDALRGTTVFEVDHPATQARKLEQLPPDLVDTRVVYVPWDFERDDLRDLPQRLHERGLDPSQPVLTIWEGVTMYLSESAIEATVRAVRELGAEPSLLALTYIDRRALAKRARSFRLYAAIAARAGEPWRFGWNPDDFPRWLSERGFFLVSDASDAELAARFFPAPVWHHFALKSRRFAVVRVRKEQPA